MKVLLVASEQPPVTSGVARTVGRIAEELGNRGHEVDIWSSVGSRRLVVGEFRFSAMASSWPAVRRELDTYDVVNLHGPAPTISDALLLLFDTLPARRCPPLVYTHHFDLDLKGWGVPCAIYNRLNRRIAHLADQVVTTTPSYQRRMTLARRAPVEVVPWAVDAKAYDVREATVYDASRPLRVLFVGQMRSYKGIPGLVRAVAGQPQIETTIVGSGPLHRKYRRLAATAAPGNVTFRGRLDDDELATLMLTHDVVALPSVSRQEAFGLALLEGMAAGCVPVASDLPGVRDVAGPTGRLVHPGDVGDLQRTLLELAKDPAEVARLKAASRRRAEGMTWDGVGASYERVLVQAVQGVGQRRPAAPRPAVIDLRPRPSTDLVRTA
jgi:glycosyltransferase involved in cell wall biosynthesis